jgi:FtsZ-interacting cell division protein ZipA
MHTYHLDPKKFSRVLRNTLIIYGVLAVVSLVLVYISVQDNLTERSWFLLLAIVALYVVGGWYSLRDRKRYWESFKLTFQDGTFTRSAHKMATFKLERARFGGFREVRGGLIVSTKANQNALFIPDDFTEQDYQAVKQHLEDWTAAED